MLQLNFDKIIVQNMQETWLIDHGLSLDVLRLDQIHPIISGNKYFKLKYHLEQAKMHSKKSIATFGGAYSNHIIATAYACRINNLESIGFIRGEEADELSHTLLFARQLGMQLKFVSRAAYKEKEKIMQKHQHDDQYWVPEGGYGKTGAMGAAEIIGLLPQNNYTHIVASVGTGTMLAGLIHASGPHVQVIGISSMKGNTSLEKDVSNLLEGAHPAPSFSIFHDYHFGGYAKHPTELITFMNEVYNNSLLPLDIVYTAKAYFALKELAEKKYFAPGSKLLFIHSGGLQGNASLPAGALSF